MKTREEYIHPSHFQICTLAIDVIQVTHGKGHPLRNPAEVHNNRSRANDDH